MTENHDQSRFFTASTPLLSAPTVDLGSTRTVPSASLYTHSASAGSTRSTGSIVRNETKEERRRRGRQCQLGHSQQSRPAMGQSAVHSFSSCFTRTHPGTHSHNRATAGPGCLFRTTKAPVLNRQTRRVKHDDPCPASQVALRLSHFRHGGCLRPRGRRPSETWHEMPCGRILPNRYNVRLCSAEQMLLCNI
jgi:hypothetical protein